MGVGGTEGRGLLPIRRLRALLQDHRATAEEKHSAPLRRPRIHIESLKAPKLASFDLEISPVLVLLQSSARILSSCFFFVPFHVAGGSLGIASTRAAATNVAANVATNVAVAAAVAGTTTAVAAVATFNAEATATAATAADATNATSAVSIGTKA